MSRRASILRDSGTVEEVPSSDLPRGLQSLGKVLGAVLAPTTAVTALAFYFAVKRQETLSRHFGIDTSVLGFSVQDYLLRGGDALFVILLFVALVGLAVIQLHRALVDRFQRARTERWKTPVIVGLKLLGLVLLLLGVVAVFEPLPFNPHFLFRSTSFGIGISLLAYGFYLDNRFVKPAPAIRETSWLSSVSVILIVVIVFLSLFWTTKDLAQALGRGQARRLEGSLATLPGAVVYSQRDLGVDAPGVVAEVLPGGETTFTYRYEGLRLLVRSDDKYFLIPDDWSHGDGVTLVLRDDDSLRVEFEPGAP
ncbi:MAG: hypothetical protein ACRDK3_04380 [Actinomycetota bacterium]